MEFLKEIEIKEEIIISSDLSDTENVEVQYEIVKYEVDDQFIDFCENENIVVDFVSLRKYTFEECSVCKSVFPNKYSLYKHNINHMNIPLTKVDSYQCHYCYYYCGKKKNLDEHKTAYHGINDHETANHEHENPLTDNHEHQNPLTDNHEHQNPLTDNHEHQNPLTDNHEHANHIIVETEQVKATKKKYECHICKKSYSYRNWHEHMRNVHCNDNLTCDQCGKSFKCQKYLYRHKLKYHERKVPSKFNEYKCEQCPKVFKSGDCLNKHVKNCHSEIINCQICNKSLKSKNYLNSHISKMHSGKKKKNTCEICKEKFQNLCLLKKHLFNMHEKKRCTKCKKIYDAAGSCCKVKSCQSNNQKSSHEHENTVISETSDDLINVDDSDDDIYRNKDVNFDDIKHLSIANEQHEVNVDNIELCEPAIGNEQDYVNIDDDITETWHDQGDVKLDAYDGIDVNLKITLNDNIHLDDNPHVNGNYVTQVDKTLDIATSQCKICNKILKSQERVKIHMVNAHSKELPVKCQYCGKFYFNLKYFGDHMRKCFKSYVNDVGI